MLRVRVLEATQLYWQYAVHEVQAGAEHVGDFARHLLHVGLPVEVLERDPEPEPGAEPQAPTETGATGPVGTGPDLEGLDIGGTIDTVLSWVGVDPARARHALEVEQARGDAARATLVGRLQQLAGAVQ